MHFSGIVSEWAWRVNDGMPDPKNRTHVEFLRDVLRESGYSESFIQDYTQNLLEGTYKDNAENRKLNRVGDEWGADPSTTKKKVDTTKAKKKTTTATTTKDTEKDDTTKQSSAGIHGDLKSGDNQDKHDVLEHGFDGVKEYYEKNGIKAEDGKGFKKPAPGSAGSAFNEIVSGEGIHILHANPNMTEEELAEKMFNEYGQTGLGQEQKKSSGIDVPPRLEQAKLAAKGKGTNKKPDNPEAFKKAEQQIATYTKCIIVARAAKDKSDKTNERVKNLQESGNFGTPKPPQTFYGTAKSLKAQKTAVENADRVIMPDGTTLRKEDVQELIRQSGGGLNPSDTATFVEDDKGTLMIQFHSDKTDPSDPQGSKTLTTDMADLQKRIDSNKTLSPEKKKAAQAVVKEFNGKMSTIETTYDDSTAAIAEKLENMDMDAQVEVMQELTNKSKTKKNYLNLAMFDNKGKGELNPKYKIHLPKGADPDNLSDAEKIQAVRSFIKTATPENTSGNKTNPNRKTEADLKVISKLSENLTKKMGKDAPEEINIKKVLAKRRTEVVDLHRSRKEELDKVEPGPPALGDLEESNEVIEGFHLSILDDEPYNENEKDQSKRLKAIMSGTFDIHMGGTVANRDTLRTALGVNSLQEFKDNFRVNEEERYTYGDGGEEGGIVTGKVVYTYVINNAGGDPIKLGEKTYRSSDGPTGTTRTIIKYADEMQQLLKDAQ